MSLSATAMEARERAEQQIVESWEDLEDEEEEVLRTGLGNTKVRVIL